MVYLYVVSLNLFFGFYFLGSSLLIVYLPNCQGRFFQYSRKCYKDIYANSFFPLPLDWGIIHRVRLSG